MDFIIARYQSCHTDSATSNTAPCTYLAILNTFLTSEKRTTSSGGSGGGGGGGVQNLPQLWNLSISNNVVFLRDMHMLMHMLMQASSTPPPPPPPFTKSLDPPLTSLQRTKRLALKCWRFHCKELHGYMVYAYAVGIRNC